MTPVGLPPAPIPLEKTEFFISSSPLFASLTAGPRRIVLTPDEARAYEAKFSVIFGTDITLVVDGGGTRALADIDMAWRGSIVLLWRDAEGWHAEMLINWIT
jgi:hypothetical protein